MRLVDERGAPLSLVVTGANRHDVTQLAPVLDALCVRRPVVRAGVLQHLCADAGFFGQPAEKAIRARHYTPHVRSRGEETHRRTKGHTPRRWIVEVAHSRFNRFRKLLVRYERLYRSYQALTMLAAASICFRKVNTTINIIYG